MRVVKNAHVLTKHLILQHTSEEAIAKYFFELASGEFAINKKIRNPYRDDKNPDCIFMYGGDGKLRFRDFAHPEYNGDCFDIVAQTMGYNKGEFNRILQEIDRELDLNLSTTQFTPTNSSIGKSNRIKIDTELSFNKVKNRPTGIFKMKLSRKLTPTGYEYFDKFNISHTTLSNNNVRTCFRFWFGDPERPKIWKNGLNEPLIVYPIAEYLPNEKTGKLERTGETYYQVYNPKSKYKNKKFRTNAKGSPLMGYDTLPEKGNLVMITSSFKDKLIFNELDIPAVCPIGEATNIPKYFIADLFDRFTNVCVCFDNDEAGLKAANKLNELYPDLYCYTVINQVGIKDPSDYVFHYGLNKFESQLFDAGIIEKKTRTE